MIMDETNKEAQQVATDTRTCSSCNETLPRHRFSRKEFQKPENQSLCNHCRRLRTAERIKQTPPADTSSLTGRVSSSGIVRRPNNFGYCNYLDQVFSLRCFKDIVELSVFNSAKDISESMAAITAISRHGLLVSEDTSNVRCLCIGDGTTPRTAVLVSFLKKWTTVSIDPQLHSVWHGDNPKDVHGLTGYRGTLEDFVRTDEYMQHQSKLCFPEETIPTAASAPGGRSFDTLVLLCVHSHARFIGDATIERIRQAHGDVPTTLVSLPCCPKFRSHSDIGREPDVQYDDDCVFSACRKVEIWRFEDGLEYVCREVGA